MTSRIFTVASHAGLLALLAGGHALADCSLTSIDVTPLPDAGPRFYKGYQCGLYPRGANTRPPSHDAAALVAAAQVQPLEANGNPNAATGKIVMISIGMSNTANEFAVLGSGAFKPRADVDPSKNPRLLIINGAQAARTRRNGSIRRRSPGRRRTTKSLEQGPHSNRSRSRG